MKVGDKRLRLAFTSYSIIIYRKGLESGICLVVEFDDLEVAVVLEFEAIAELDTVAAAVLIDFGDDCSGGMWC